MIPPARREIQLLVPMLILIGIGWVMVFSTSAANGLVRPGGSVFMYLKRQVLATIIGAGAMFWLFRTPLSSVHKAVPKILAASSALMLAVFIPGLGRSVAQATRWINLGFLSFQPVEVFKLTVVLGYAWLLSGERPGAQWTRETWAKVAGLGLLSVALPILQRDFGSAVLMLVLGLIIIWLAGAPVRYLAVLGGVAAVLAAAALVSAPYRLHRLSLWLSSVGGGGGGYQTTQSLIALGAGGIFGVGLGESSQKLFYLPSAHADFIFSILGEELGLIGALSVLALYTWLLREGMRVAEASRARFVRLLAAGMSLTVFMQALWHIAVAVVLVPTKGLALPFVSYGGSSLIASMLAVGLVMRCAEDSQSGVIGTVATPVGPSGSRMWAPS